MYTSKLGNPIIHLESKPRLKDGLKEKVSLALVSLNSCAFCGYE